MFTPPPLKLNSYITPLTFTFLSFTVLLAFANDATDTDISSSDNDTTSAETFYSVTTN